MKPNKYISIFKSNVGMYLRCIRKNVLLLAVAGCTLGTSLLSCDMVNEDMPPCAIYPNTFTTVNFVYDYNMFREDLFNEHAGTAHLYVFDKDSVFLFDRAISRNDMTGPEVDFSMTFDTTEIKPGKRYLMLAMAQGNHSGYEWSTVVTPGFQIPLEHQMVPGVSKISDYRIMLDRDSDSWADIGVVDYTDAYGGTKQMLDTLWSTKPGNIQTVEIPWIEYKPQVEEYPTYYYDVTIPMMRITNAITVNLLHDGFDENYDVNRFNILIDFPKGNGTIGFTGRTYPNRELFYRALRKEMKLYNKKQGSADVDASDKAKGLASRADDTQTYYSMQATFGVSRLQVVDDSSLQIRDGETNEILLQIGGPDGADIGNGMSFSEWLANYFNSQYDDQEFLDREYNFTIDIHLNDKYIWDWYEITVESLGWTIRRQNMTIM